MTIFKGFFDSLSIYLKEGLRGKSRGGKMCQIVEGHKITIPQKGGGGAERICLLISKKSERPRNRNPLNMFIRIQK